VPRGDSREPDPRPYDPKQLSKIPKDFLDDAAACILYSGNTYLVDADGTIETITHDQTRLNGRKGIEKLGEYRNITYDPSYQKLTLNVARIHKADGSIREITPRHVQLRDVSTDYQVYDHEKQLIISFPSLEVGDVIEVKWTVRGKNPEHDGRFFTRYSFGDITYPVVLDDIRVRLPKDMPFKYACEAGKVEPQVREKDGQRLYRWHQDLCPRLPQDENLPSREEMRASIVCSTFPSWEAVGKWKQKLRADCWTCTADVSKVVDHVTKGLTDPVAKARALTYWLRRNVRYISAGEKHDYTPHPPGEVLANRFGDCKDTSQLLAVMLTQAGIQVELATLGVQDDGQVVESVPSPWGTHAILMATINGKQHWIDTTASLSGWDFLPHDDHDRLCYLVDRKGTIRLLRTPKLTAADNRVEQVTEVYIGTDGSSRCERIVTSYGSAAMLARDSFLDVPSGERRRQVAGELQDSNSKTHLVSLKLNDAELKDYDRPVTVRMGFEILDHFSGTTEREGSVSDSKVWGKLLAYNLDYDREPAVQYYAPFESDHRYIIHLPAAFYLESVPPERSVKSAWGEFKLTVKKLSKGDTVRDVELRFQTRLDKTRIQPADFVGFRKFHEGVMKHYRTWLTLRPVTDLGEAPLLEAMLAWAPGDLVTSTTLAQVYLQENKKEDAHRVLQAACHYNPDEASLWELAVRAAGTMDQEETIQRELVRRFPMETKYAISLGSVLITAGKHDEARAVLEPLTRDDSDTVRAEAHYQLARAFYRKDDLKTGLMHLDEAAKANAETVNTVKAHHLRGQTLEEMGKIKEATQAYQQALKINGKADETLEALVRLSLAQHRTGETLDYLRRYALAVNDDLNGLLKAADYYYRLKHYDEAYELASKARDLRFHERAQRLLGQVLLQRGDHARALFHLDKAEIDAVVAEGLLRCCLELGDLTKLKDRVEQIKGLTIKASAELTATLDRATLLLTRRAELDRELLAPAEAGEKWAIALDAIARAEGAYRDGSVDRVPALLAPALASKPEIGAAYAWRGRLSLEHGKLTAALDDAERAIRLSPAYAMGYYVRGRVRQERGDKTALDDLKRAVELNGKKDADMLHYLAEALHRAGQRDAALTAQRLAVKLKPQDKEMAEQLRAFEKEGGE
jgi:tetratricopeptide (TPR) repeat protein